MYIIIILNQYPKMLKQATPQFLPSSTSPSTQTQLIDTQTLNHRQTHSKNRQQLIKQCKSSLRQYIASIIRRMFKYDTVQHTQLLGQLAEDIFPVRQYVAEYVIKHKRSRTLRQNISLLRITANENRLQSIAAIYELLEGEIRAQEQQMERCRRKKQKQVLQRYQNDKENVSNINIHVDKQQNINIHPQSSLQSLCTQNDSAPKNPSPLLNFITSVIWNQASSISKLWKKQQKLNHPQPSLEYEQAYACSQEYVEGWWNKYVAKDKGTSINDAGLIKHD